MKPANTNKSHKCQPVRGTHDCLPEQSARRRALIERAMAVTARYGYGEISTPIFEFTEVFARTLGESSDVVNKEMYTFEDRGGEHITLRPEFTAGIARAFISGGLQQHAPLKLVSVGPVFRYERPQKGRMRQFHQFDAECIGIADPVLDAEMIAMAMQVLEAIGVKDKVRLEMNSLGDAASRAAYRDALVAYLTPHKAELSEDSQRRLAQNPLRILDSKDAGDRAIVANAPEVDATYSDEARMFFDTVRRMLDAMGVEYLWNKRLVRGLDYYSHTVFECITDQLGAQGTVLAGGRYDGLIGMMGGTETPAIGWAAGIERLEELAAIEVSTPPVVAVIPTGADVTDTAFVLANELRQAGMSVQFDYSGNMKKRLNRADKNGAHYAVILGSDEVARNVVLLRQMQGGEQQEVSRADIVSTLQKHH